MNSQPTEDREFEDAFQFIVKLGTSTHAYGSTATRLEYYLSQVSSSLGFHGEFRSGPTEIYFALSREGSLWQRTHLVTMPTPGFEILDCWEMEQVNWERRYLM